jgi:sialidase-1
VTLRLDEPDIHAVAHADADTTVVRRARHRYSSHPCIAALANGDLLVAFCETIQSDPFLHPPSDPRHVNMIVRSSDRGRTWSEPRAVPGYDWYGVETPGLAQLSNGDVLLNQWRFLWYPLETGRRLWAEGTLEAFVCGPLFEPSAHGWFPARDDVDWDRHPFPYVRADGGAYVHRSSDDGRTWSETVAVDIGPYRGAFSPKGVVELADGDLLLALGSHDYDPAAASFVVRSKDRGASWEAPVEVARRADAVYSEPAAVVLHDGSVLVFSREENRGYIHVSRSGDGGRSWSQQEPLPYWGYPAHAVSLADGRVVVVYGRRRAPFGIRAAISEDAGASWSEEIVIRDDLPNDNLGYPSVVEVEPGRLLVVYYGEDGTGTTGIHGTYFTL